MSECQTERNRRGSSIIVGMYDDGEKTTSVEEKEARRKGRELFLLLSIIAKFQT